MMNQKMLDALSGTIYAAKLSLKGENVDDDDKRICASGLYEDWKEGTIQRCIAPSGTDYSPAFYSAFWERV